MYTFHDYKNLSGELSGIATSLWVAELRSRLGEISLYKLPICLSELGASHLDGFNEQKSKYWNDKYNGQPLRNDLKVKAIESVLPGSSSILYHPLWFLLNCPEPNNADLLEVASNLQPKTYQRIVGEKEGELYLKILRTEIGFENTLDVLTVKLIYHHWQKNNWRTSVGAEWPDTVSSVETHKLFLRLFSIRYDDKFATLLYQLINQRFNTNDSVAEPFTLPNSNLPISDFPLGFGKRKSDEQVKRVITAASQIIKFVSYKFGISHKKNKMKLFNYVSWKKINCLLKNLDCWDKTKGIENYPYLFAYVSLIYFDEKKLTKLNELDYDYRNRYVPNKTI